MKRCEWSRGYFCAVAKLMELDGLVSTDAQELFGAGGDWKQADPEDIKTFRKYGAIPNAERLADEAGGKP